VLITIFGTTTSTTAFGQQIQSQFSLGSPATTFVGGSGVSGIIRMHIVVINGTTSGTVSLQAAASNTGQTVTIRTNSDIEANKTN
jgi:hypothetical protein